MGLVHMLAENQQTFKTPRTKRTLINMHMYMYPKFTCTVKLLLARIALVHVLVMFFQVCYIQPKLVKLETTEYTLEH